MKGAPFRCAARHISTPFYYACSRWIVIDSSPCMSRLIDSSPCFAYSSKIGNDAPLAIEVTSYLISPWLIYSCGWSPLPAEQDKLTCGIGAVSISNHIPFFFYLTLRLAFENMGATPISSPSYKRLSIHVFLLRFSHMVRSIKKTKACSPMPTRNCHVQVAKTAALLVSLFPSINWLTLSGSVFGSAIIMCQRMPPLWENGT